MQNVGVLDIRDQCSGFVYALSTADQFIRSGMYKNILVIGAEIQSTFLNHTTEGRGVAVIFGDGAGAAVVQATTDPRIEFFRRTYTPMVRMPKTCT
jgi:3-oxoacyl-[acyl-carrier-protein] synthase-3